MPSIRITAREPSGKQHQIQFPQGTYTDKDVEVIQEKFREWIHAGKSKQEFMLTLRQPRPLPESNIPTISKGLFPSCDVLNLTLPTNGGCSWLCIGSTRSGKSSLMLQLYETYFKKHITLLITLSSHADIYKPLAKKAIISPAFFPELVNETMAINRGTGNQYPFCLIFDDMALDGKNSQEMTKALTIGRNSALSIIYCAQRLEMMNPTGRTNCNYVCLFRLNTDSAIEDVIKTYLRSYFPGNLTIQECIKLYKDQTADHHFFFVNTLEDTVHLCKVALPGEQ